MDQINNQNGYGSPGVGYTPMQFPDSFGTGLTGATNVPGVVANYQPMQFPEIPTTPASYTHMPDGSWADAQVTLSSAATAPAATAPATTAPSTDGTAPAPGSKEEQIAQLTQMYMQSMEFENMMFQQQMMMMQQRAAMQQQQAIAARNNLNNNTSNTKLLTGPDIRATDFLGDGGDGGDGGEE